ncbi:MAG: trypsin-like peptidase domain-containing protein [Phycisphaeraceae bacterium]
MHRFDFTTRILASLLITAIGCATFARADESIARDELAKVKAAEAARIAVIDQVSPAVVAIYGKQRTGGGSGVLISPDGLALTNFHVVAGAGEEGLAGLPDGRLYHWRLVGLDPGGDLAIIQLLPPLPSGVGEGRGEGATNDPASPAQLDRPHPLPGGEGTDPADFAFPYAMLGDSAALLPGDWVMAMGNPFVLSEDHKPTVTLGIVSGVERFQEGEGGKSSTMLVYGNAIQVDSSINPGNSGGPLFDMRGQVVGINGRGSFEERGRVNVGLGYAISMEQVRNFIPDLLATKVAMHGTLEATFIDRNGMVICNAVNLDAPIGAKGMSPGDRLIRVAGHDIRTANHFNNLITIFPADWPVEVVWEHEKKERQAWVRLTPVKYPTPAARPAPATQPAQEPAPPAPKRTSPPGEIQVPELNRAMARRVIQQYLVQSAGHVEPVLIAAATLPILRLEGGDWVDGRRAYRLYMEDDKGNGRRAWFSVFDKHGQFATDVLKVDTETTAAAKLPALVNGADDEVHQVVTPSQPAPSAFHGAIAAAQARTVKLLGAGIARESGNASGLIVSPDGDILTAQGVYIASPSLRVVLPDGSAHYAKVVRRSQRLQAVLLKIDVATPDYFDLGVDPSLANGDWVVAVANPFKVATGSEPMSANLGIMALRAQLDLKKKMQDVPYDGDVLLIDAITSNPGSPGGALVGIDGRLAGMIGKIIESKSSGTRLNYAVPADLLAAFVKGTLVEEPAATVAAAAGAPAETGIRIFMLGGKRAPAYVDHVIEGSPAAAAGLRKDDLILGIDGQIVRDIREYQQLIAALVPGKTINIVIKRDRDVLSVPLTPAEGER